MQIPASIYLGIHHLAETSQIQLQQDSVVQDSGSMKHASQRRHRCAGIREHRVLHAIQGVRPTLFGFGAYEDELSRDYAIVDHGESGNAAGLYSMTGGKLASYRLMAEDATNRLCAVLGVRAPCRTAEEPLFDSAQVKAFSGILPPEFCREIVEYFCKQEWAVHLDDVMIRRGGWHAYDPEVVHRAPEVAEWMAELFDWSPQRRQDELDRYGQLVVAQPSGQSPNILPTTSGN